ncbi:MAG: acetylxylan esterase [Bryobacteraceae bacterium]
MLRLAFRVAAGLVPLALLLPQQSDLNFLTQHVDGRDISRMLPNYLKAKALGQLDARKQEVARIRTSQDLAARREYIRRQLTAHLGGFPEKTPLNARVTATLDLGTHRVEKIIFESQPGFPVTANLYLPKSGTGPFPAILFPLGHEAGAKAHEAWQYLLHTFAQRGYVCLAWDTIGQGERIQLWDEDTQQSKVVASTTEHTVIGLQTMLVGESVARYTIWDGIRALDYLLSRPEVDRKRVGLTGNSGGGTHTSYLAAIDDRFAAAAPSCYLTNWRRLLETIGPQDAEQCIPPFLASGLDHPDFVYAAGPKPFKMLVAIRDFFSIEGARETYAEVSRVYDSVGFGDRFSKFEADDGHGYTQPRRAESYRFFSKALTGTEDTRPEPDIKILSEHELWATKTGQVATSLPNSESVYSINQKRFAQVRQRGATLESVRKFTGFAPMQGAPAVTPYGRIDRPGFSIEKLTYESEPGIRIPSLLYVPAGSGRKPAVILAWGSGKAAANSAAEELARNGSIVLSVDLRGLGETRAVRDNYSNDWARYFGDYESSMTALLTGKPLVIQRAEDIARAVDLLSARADVERITVRGRELAAIPALHAAAFDSRIAGATVERMVTSWESVIRHRIHKLQWENVVQGALRHYDLADLVKWSAPRHVEIVEPLNPLGLPAL